MSRLQQFALPDLGEGLTEGEILRWLVSTGDTVQLNQPLVEVETAKAAVEVPSPYAGVVTRIHHAAGEVVDVGSPLVTVDTEPASGHTGVLVGYGPKTAAAGRRPRVAPPVPSPVPPAANAVRAKPPVRRLAADLGVDLAALTGTGPDGTVTRSDVQAAAPAAPAGERRVPVTGVRRHTAAAMVSSAFTAPHVTVFLTLDVTPTMDLRARLAARPEWAGVAVSPLLFAAKALLLAVRRHPEVNSSWDEAAQEIVVKDDVHLGIAVATPRGLLVPTVRNADRMDLLALARALQSLAETARAGRTSPAELAGGTITITNVGTFGVDSGTPILPPGQAAILCLGAVRAMPWVVDGEVAVRQVTQLSLSFDHRHVDGQLGSQLLADVGRVLADPGTALLW